MSDIRIPINLNNKNEKVVRVNLEQEFETLDVLSLKITSTDAYRRMCSDFGVIVGRVTLTNGFGVQNAKVTVFVPISADDQERPEITQLYPFTSLTDTYPNGVRYNLLPRVRGANPSHRAVGNFPNINDFVHYPQSVEVFEKYYKYTTITNHAGDYMIFGVPLGKQDVVMDFDVFDTESFDISANDLVQLTTVNNALDSLGTLISAFGTTTSQTVDPNKIPDYTYYGNNNFAVEIKLDISSMPNIFHGQKTINVAPFWGDDNFCDVGITRCDFTVNFKYTPSAVFFGYLDSLSGGFTIDSATYKMAQLQDNTKAFPNQPQILATDSSLGYMNGDIYPFQNPKVVVYKLADDGVSRQRTGVYELSVNNGIFRLALPMYEDYYSYNEFGDLLPSKDKKTGIPTKGHYTFEFYENSESWYGRRQPEGWYSNPILPGFRVPSTNDGDPNLGGWNDISTSLFEYDIHDRKRRFYTLKTTYYKHTIDDVRESGNYVSWFPYTSPYKVSNDIYWNYPVDFRDIPNITNDTNSIDIIGSVLMPRIKIDLQPTAYPYPAPNSTDDIISPAAIINIPYIDGSVTYNTPIKEYEKYLGIGVGLNGVNSGDVFRELYSAGSFFNSNGVSTYGQNLTWDYGDNTTLPAPFLTGYALELQNVVGSTANSYGIQNPYTQAVNLQYTYGPFINSVEDIFLTEFMDFNVVDITDDLDVLISNGVYSSFRKGDITQAETDYSKSINSFSTTNYKANLFNNNFYYFGRFEPNNALKDIELYYKVKK